MDDSQDLLPGASTVYGKLRRLHKQNSSHALALRVPNQQRISRSMSASVKILHNNPPPALTELDVSDIREFYGLPSSVVLRLPLSSERVADTRPDEIVVYEPCFSAGLRATVPSLVVEMANRFAISPGQFSPAAWTLLISIQAFGELDSINIRVDGILYAYSVVRLEADPGRYPLHPQNGQQ